MANKEFKLPDLGEGIHEGEIIAVRVAPGDTVAEGDVILEVETDKAAVEIPSPYSGLVTAVQINAGDVVQVGQVLLVFETASGKEIPDLTPSASPSPAKTPRSSPAEPIGHESGRTRPGPVPASPATRRLARELGIDLTVVAGSGPAGLVTAEDVRASAHKGTALDSLNLSPAEVPTPAASVDKPGAPQGPPAVLDRIAYKSVRRAIGRQMARAWAAIPHVTSQDVVDVTRLELLRRRHKGWIAEQGGHLSLTVLILKAAVQALKTYPSFNAVLELPDGDDADGTIVQYGEYHVGIAVDTPDGLIVPVVRHADRQNIVELSQTTRDLVRRTRERKVALAELTGGTFTITNVGRDGGAFFTPIINHPQVAILGVGGARMEPALAKDPHGKLKTVPRLMLPLTLTIDHRVLDGADAGRFLNLLKQMIQDPEKLLLMV